MGISLSAVFWFKNDVVLNERTINPMIGIVLALKNNGLFGIRINQCPAPGSAVFCEFEMFIRKT